MRERFLSVVFSVGILASAAVAQNEPKKSILASGDWKRVELLNAASISHDGRWISAITSPVEGDATLTIKNSDEPIGFSITAGRSARFTQDSKFVAYQIGTPRAIAEKLRAEKKPITDRLGIRILPVGIEKVIENVDSFDYVLNDQVVVARRSRPATSQEPRSDLTLVRLEDGESVTFGNVNSAAVNKQKNLLAMVIRADNGERGVQLFDLSSKRLTTLMWGKDEIASLQWAPDADTLAWLAGPPESGNKVGTNFRIHAVKVANGSAHSRSIYDPSEDEKLPKDYRVSDSRGLILSDSGDRIAFGAQRWKERAKPTKPEETPNVEVWNTKDVVVVPAQKVRFRAIENASDVYVWNGGKNAVRISEGLNRSVALVSDLKKAVVANQAAYRTAQTTGVDPVDVDLVDTETGARSHLTKKTYFAPIPSGEGKYLMWFDQKNWTLIDVETGKFVPVTARLRKSFENEETDVPRPVNPYAALPYWLKDDEGVLVQDMYDVFLYRPATDSLTQLTFGQKEGVMYDPVDVIAEDDERGSIKDPIFLSAFHRVDKSSGFAKVSASGEFKALTFDAKAMGGLARAKDTDRMIFTMSTFAEPVSLYLTNTEFSAAKPVLRTNPWIKDYHWGKSELVQFKSRWGVPLQGVLIYPADYDPKRSYPMVTYIYERLSDSLHQFIRPLENSAYNEQWLSQNGYFVFKPDIVYRDGTPGQDAVDCLEPALGAAFAKNVGIDPDRVALMGHSWGGYQTAFVTTVSKRFAVGVAGAPLTELTSMYSTIYWNSGTPNQEIFESSQGRMRLPFWEIPDKYFANSPVWQVQKRTAPLLMTFGDSDGAVDFRQGVQFYTTLRRLGKEAVMLVYPGENHGLARPANRLDYAQRVRHYLDVYLKKAKPEAWITDGVPYSPPAGVPATTGAPMSGSSG